MKSGLPPFHAGPPRRPGRRGVGGWVSGIEGILPLSLLRYWFKSGGGGSYPILHAFGTRFGILPKSNCRRCAFLAIIGAPKKGPCSLAVAGAAPIPPRLVVVVRLTVVLTVLTQAWKHLPRSVCLLIR